MKFEKKRERVMWSETSRDSTLLKMIFFVSRVLLFCEKRGDLVVYHW
jgi:hypothetical protein